MLKRLMALGGLLLLTACGGGGSGSGSAASSSTTTSTPPAALTNLVSVIVDQGPASLATGPGAYGANNVA
jgi:ABC-type glycerol-3-phosphate transport system substrate-binding protein